jgi:hypothetical protein
MSSHGNKLLIGGGISSLAIAVLHIAIIIIGIPAYRSFGGVGDNFANMLEAGSVLPTLLTSSVTLVFAIFGCYALSGAGAIRRLPLLRTGLIVVASIYLLRGLMNIPFWLTLTPSTFPEAFKGVAFSVTSLVIGLFYASGTAMNWRRLNGSE